MSLSLDSLLRAHWWLSFTSICARRGSRAAENGKRLAVDDVSFFLGAGEIYGLVHGNGAGKTTPIEMAYELLEPNGGTMTIADGPTAGNPSINSLLGYAPQYVALYPGVTAHESLAFLGRS
jgi:ABC-type multidrug transport system ATPase subunit